MSSPAIIYPSRQQLGSALVNAGVINMVQLREALAARPRFPELSLGQIITVLHGISGDVVDDVHLRAVVMPLFPDELLGRLRNLARRDRFLRGMDFAEYLTGVRALIRTHEVKVVESRKYEYTPDQRHRPSTLRRYLSTDVEVRAVVHCHAGTAKALLHLRHHSETHALQVLENDDRLRSTLYYDLKALHFRALGRRPPRKA